VIIDSFTRFCELYPLASTGADEAAVCLMNFLGRYGEPDQIISDRGTQFLNQVFHHMAIAMDYHLEHMLTGSKEENAIVERSIREVLRHLIAIVNHRKVNKIWAQVLPMVQRIMNATVHSALGVSPAQILFGNAVRLERGMFKSNPFLENGARQSPFHKTKNSVRLWIDRMLSNQQACIDAALETISARDAEHISSHPLSELTVFPVNSYVLVAYPKSAMGRKAPNKLTPPWRGPLRVVSIDHNEYTLHNLVTGRLEVQHITSLREYRYDAAVTSVADLTEIALRDVGEFEIDVILDHFGDNTDQEGMKFLVK
jgi:hypothetical protein